MAASVAMNPAPIPLPTAENLLSNDVASPQQTVDSENRKKVWANPLDIDEKQSDVDMLYYIEELMKLGRISEAAELSVKLPHELQKSERISFILEEKKLIDTRIQDLENFDGWDLQVDGERKSSEGISVYYRYTPGSPIVEIKSTFRVDANFANLCCIANEIDLWPMFMSKLLTVETKECSRYGFSTTMPYLNVKLPWPMSHREAYFELRVYDLITDRKLCLVSSKNLGDCSQYRDFKIPDVKSGKIRVKHKLTAMGKTVSYNVTEMTMMFKIDFVIALPQRFINWATRNFAWRVIKEFRKLCVSMPGVHVERKKEDRGGIYTYLDDRMRIVFKDLPA